MLYLIKNEADVHKTDREERDELHLASARGYENVLKTLLDKNTNTKEIIITITRKIAITIMMKISLYVIC